MTEEDTIPRGVPRYRRHVSLQDMMSDDSKKKAAIKYLNENAIPMTNMPVRCAYTEREGLVRETNYFYIIPEIGGGALLTELQMPNWKYPSVTVTFIGEKANEKAIDDYVDMVVDTIGVELAVVEESDEE